MDVSQKTSRQSGSYLRVMRFLYVLFTSLFGLCLLIQVFLAGLGIFVASSLINMHIGFAHFFELLPLLMFIFALLGRLPRALSFLSLLLIVQFSLQYAFIRLPGVIGVPFIAAFHPVNAVLMFWVMLIALRRGIAILKNPL